jgi:hemerythrin-like domain-containing protein
MRAMATIIDHLETDHRNFASLLKILDRELASIAAIEEPDYPLMALVLDYLLTYPDQVHHPKEDLIYQMLLRKLPEIRDSLDDLEHEHMVLANLTRDFANTLRDVVAGEAVMREELLSAGRAFVDTYKNHMLSENVGVFKLARQHLPAIDMDTLMGDFETQSDALRANHASGRFERLLETIKSASS